MSELSAYEKELYDFLTQPENFKGMMLAAAQAEMVKRNLLREFWNEFEQAMISKLQSQSTWKVIIVNKSAHPIDWKMRIFKTNWNPQKLFEVCWGYEIENGKLFYGLINNQDQARHPIIREKLDAEPGDWKSELSGRPTAWYPAWNWEGLQLTTNEAYEQLLPNARIARIEDNVQRTADFLERVSKTVDKIFASLPPIPISNPNTGQ
jgi:hypothetical protein